MWPCSKMSLIVGKKFLSRLNCNLEEWHLILDSLADDSIVLTIHNFRGAKRISLIKSVISNVILLYKDFHATLSLSILYLGYLLFTNLLDYT